MPVNFARRCLSLSLFLLAFPACGLLQPGQRLLHIEIEQDGKLVFSGIRGVPDSTPVKQMWDVVGGIPFKAAGDEVAGATDQDAESANLTGKVVIRIKHVDRILAETTVSQLQLTRSADKATWVLAADEAERIRRQVNSR
jgi:hypothetical protein